MCRERMQRLQVHYNADYFQYPRTVANTHLQAIVNATTEGKEAEMEWCVRARSGASRNTRRWSETTVNGSTVIPPVPTQAGR